jgi:hypothetical protein
MTKLAICTLTVTFAVAFLAVVVARRDPTDLRGLVDAVRASSISGATIEHGKRRIQIVDPELIGYLFLCADESLEMTYLSGPIATFYGEFGAQWTAHMIFDDGRLYVGRLTDEFVGDKEWYMRVIPLTEPVPKWVEEIEQFLDADAEPKDNVLTVSAGGVTNYNSE